MLKLYSKFEDLCYRMPIPLKDNAVVNPSMTFPHDSVCKNHGLMSGVVLISCSVDSTHTVKYTHHVKLRVSQGLDAKTLRRSTFSRHVGHVSFFCSLH